MTNPALPTMRAPIFRHGEIAAFTMTRLQNIPGELLDLARQDFLALLNGLDTEHTPEIAAYLRAELRQALTEDRVTGSFYSFRDDAYGISTPRGVCGCILGTIYIAQIAHYAPDVQTSDLIARVDRLSSQNGDGRSPLEAFAYVITPRLNVDLLQKEISNERRAQFLAWMDEFDTLRAPATA